MRTKAKPKAKKKTARYVINIGAVAELPAYLDAEAYLRELATRLAAINPDWESFRIELSKATKKADIVPFSNQASAGGPGGGGRGPAGGTTTTTTSTTTTTFIPAPTPSGNSGMGTLESRLIRNIRQ